MKKFESASVLSSAEAEAVYNKCASFEKLEAYMPDQIEDWLVEDDEVSFQIRGMTHLTLAYQEKTPFKKVIIRSVHAPFAIELMVEITDTEDSGSCAVKTTLLADLNPMLAMLASRPLQYLVDTISVKLAE